jgi:hypothetical protein
MARRAWTLLVSLSPDCGTSFTRIWSDKALSPEGDRCFKNTFDFLGVDFLRFGALQIVT